MLAAVRTFARLSRVPSTATTALSPSRTFAAASSAAAASAAAAAKKKKASGDSATFELRSPFEYALQDKLEAFGALPSTEVEATREEMMAYYREMLFFRRLEIMADNLYKARFIRGFCHLYDGQEAITTGMEAVMGEHDSIITAYRDHTTAIGRGDTGESVMAELMGKFTGSSKGKGGSMHFYNPANNYYGGNGIVGAQVPVGTGVAWASKYRGDGGVCYAMYGDGAANQGQIYEAANIAALWKIPAIYVCENNTYGMGTSVERASANSKFYERMVSLNIPGMWIDAHDVLAVKQGLKFASDYARENGPIMCELKTYRYHGHSMSDPGVSYRSREEVQTMRKTRDCIEIVKQRILEQEWATDKDLKAIDKEVRAQVDKDIEAAKAAEFPPAEELTNEIYVDETPSFIRGVEFEKSFRS